MTEATTTVAAAVRASGSRQSLKRVAFVVSQFPETHETFILREFAGLRAAGLDFVILSLKPCRDRVIQRGARAFLDTTYYPFGRPAPRLSLRRTLGGIAAAGASLPWLRSPLKCAYVSWAAARLAEVARQLGVGHVHAHWATAPASAALLMSKILRVTYSFTAHAWDIYAGDGCLAAKARAALFIATCTKANVDYIRARLPAGDRDKVILNYHGIPLAVVPAARKAASGVMRITAVGRLVETKGFDYLLRALEQIRFPFQLTIIGDGPLRRPLETAAAAAGISDRTRFAGIVPNEEVFETLSNTDVFVMPSVIARDGDRDGIPNVLLEAMSVGVPVIASGISGIPEAVIDARTGIIVPEKDPPAIAAALTTLHSSPDEAARLGARAAQFVSANFCAETNARKLFEIFKRHVSRGEE